MKTASIGAHVGVLALLVMSATQVVSALTVLSLPPPAAPSLRLKNVAAAVRNVDSARALGFVVERRNSPPAGTRAVVVEIALADLLGMKPQDVRASWLARPLQQDPTVEVVTLTLPRAGSRDGMVADLRADAVNMVLQDPGVDLPAFRVGLRMRDGGWRVFEPVTDRGPWQRRLLAGFLLCATLIAPLAWLASRRVTRSVRALSELATSLARGDGAALTIPRGPREVDAAAASMRTMAARLRAESDERVRMLAAVAHDLRTPLASLRLRADLVPGPGRRRMVDDVLRMDQMIARVLEYVRSACVALDRQPHDLGNIADQCVAILREQGHAIAVHASVRASALVDAEHVARALTNLLENAVRYANEVELALGEDAGEVWIEVRDRGPGIPQEQLLRMVQPFERLDRSRNRGTGGLGLGLSIADESIRRQGGRLTLVNRIGGGLEARIIFPRFKPPASAP